MQWGFAKDLGGRGLLRACINNREAKSYNYIMKLDNFGAVLGAIEVKTYPQSMY